MNATEVICFTDKDGDILRVDTEPDPDGERYVAVISAGDEQGVVLTAEQQDTLATTLLGYDPLSVEPHQRADAAMKAGDILQGTNMFGKVAPRATEVIALAEWIAYGDTGFAFSIEALGYVPLDSDEDCCD